MYQCRSALVMIQKFILIMFAAGQKQRVALALNLDLDADTSGVTLG